MAFYQIKATHADAVTDGARLRQEAHNAQVDWQKAKMTHYANNLNNSAVGLEQLAQKAVEAGNPALAAQYLEQANARRRALEISTNPSQYRAYDRQNIGIHDVQDENGTLTEYPPSMFDPVKKPAPATSQQLLDNVSNAIGGTTTPDTKPTPKKKEG